MIDINIPANVATSDLTVTDTDLFKASNVLAVQIGSLEYAPDFGIDLDFFLSEDFEFQDESFKSYLIQVLANNNINVTDLTENIEKLFSDYIITISKVQAKGTLIAR